MPRLPATMHAVLLNGHGGFDQLEYRTDVAVPVPGRGEVLIRVAAAGINNTDINTRIGWYSKSVRQGTGSAGATGFADARADGAWSGGAMEFPRIQGADCCGYVVATGRDVPPPRVGERVLVRTMMRGRGAYACFTFGSECDGAFAQFTVAPAREAYPVISDWSDVELASIPCAYSTAENMLHRVRLGAETVLITGASGGVGSAAVQLAGRRGATVVALASSAKAKEVRALGADRVVDRGVDLVAALGEDSVDVVVDVVGGEQWPYLLDVLRRGGRYVTAGAIAGPIAQLDLRTLYLKDLTLLGCTFQEDVVFENLISYIEAGEIRPHVAAVFPLQDIVRAQEAFLAKTFTGKLVLTIPEVEEV